MSVAEPALLRSARQGVTDKKPIPAKIRAAPFSKRLSEPDRARLAVEAAGAPLGAYIKAKVLGEAPLRLRRTGLCIQDREALAQVLALLGNSEIPDQLAQLSFYSEIGSLPLPLKSVPNCRRRSVTCRKCARCCYGRSAQPESE